MWKISEIFCFLLLLIAAVMDIKSRKITVWLLMMSFVTGSVYQLFTREMNWLQIVGGAAVGGIFLIVSKVTREGLGYGDSIGIGILGIFLGFLRVLTVLSIAFFLVFCMSVPMLWRKKMSKKYTLPFYPFLTAGYICMLCIERIPV